MGNIQTDPLPDFEISDVAAWITEAEKRSPVLGRIPIQRPRQRPQQRTADSALHGRKNVAGGLARARPDPLGLPDPAEEPLDPVAFPAEPPVKGAGVPAAGTGGDAGPGAVPAPGLQRLKPVDQGPERAGRSRRGVPVRRTKTMPSMTPPAAMTLRSWRRRAPGVSGGGAGGGWPAPR